MNIKLILKRSFFVTLVAIASIMTGCQPDEVTSGNELFNDNLDASFTVVNGASPNRFSLQGSAEGTILQHRWELGDGSAEYKGQSTEEIFLPDAGTYEVKHTVWGSGGTSVSSVQTVTVSASDPISGNLARGGKFRNDSDIAEWTVLNISANNSAIVFNPAAGTVPSHVNITATGYSGKGIYQAIEVVGGRKYKIDMRVFGGGSTETWFEAYASTTAPIPNQDYSADGRRIGMSTWDGCATGPFDGQLTAVGCVGSGAIVEFAESGTIYLLIKAGGNNMGPTGISFTNVEFRGQAE